MADPVTPTLPSSRPGRMSTKINPTPSHTPNGTRRRHKHPTFTTARSYPESHSSAISQTVPDANLQRSQRRSKVEAISKLDRAAVLLAQPPSAPVTATATSFLPPPPLAAGPSVLRNPLHRPVVPNPPFSLDSVRTQAPRRPAPRTQPRLFGLQECPTFYPTEAEFADPMAYIGALPPSARDAGICKIVPPEGWKMPFSLDSDTFKFRTRLQRLNSLEAASRATMNLVEQLTMFHLQQGDPAVEIPIIDRERLNLWKLRKEVNKAGGHHVIDRNAAWGEICAALGIAPEHRTEVRKAFVSIILPFDTFVTRVRTNTVSPRTSSARPPSRMSAGFASPRAQSDPTRHSPILEPRTPHAGSEPPLGAPLELGPKRRIPGFSTPDGAESESDLSDEMSATGPARASSSASSALSTPGPGVPYQKGEVCEVCHGGHSPDKMLLCDTCDRGKCDCDKWPRVSSSFAGLPQIVDRVHDVCDEGGCSLADRCQIGVQHAHAQASTHTASILHWQQSLNTNGSVPPASSDQATTTASKKAKTTP